MTVVEAATELSMQRQIAWSVMNADQAQSLSQVTSSMRDSLARGEVVHIPTTADRNFNAKFAVPSAAYCLAFIYCWVGSTVGELPSMHINGSLSTNTVADLTEWIMATVTNGRSGDTPELGTVANLLRQAAVS
ncbi:MAG TPA: hypothetical protein VFX16_24700 [Pseudonocardiaceae bacterium]|nr:hypothetical protein [Pseudonocardiaceae bacterium]